MTVYLQYALTPPTTEGIRQRISLQNVGYSADWLHLLSVNLHTNRAIQMFGGYRLWGQLASKQWELLEQCTNPEAIMWAEDPTCWRTPAGQANLKRHIAEVWSVEGYVQFLCWRDAPGHMGLVADPEFWSAEYGITTAAQLADYMQGCHTRNMEKSERYG